MKAILQLKLPTSSEETKLFPGAIQSIAKTPPRISEITDQIGQFEKKWNGNRQKKNRKFFFEKRNMMTEIASLVQKITLTKETEVPKL